VSRSRALVLDFDGVVCDGFAECALVTWNAHFERPVDDFSPRGLEQLPPAFLERFRHTRAYARHLGHFLVAVLAGSRELATQTQFDECYHALPTPVIDAFVDRAGRYRDQARARFPNRWLNYHELYPGLAKLLADVADEVYVVTAKDRASVLSILNAAGIGLAPDRVYGEQRDKLAALADVARREGVQAGQLDFVDDNLPNVLAARTAGYQAHWAAWGFSAPEHHEQAGRLGLPALPLSKLAGVLAAAPAPAVPRRRLPAAATTPTGVLA
jgi:HAD superfamily hydrolase (TIGR01509 family)